MIQSVHGSDNLPDLLNSQVALLDQLIEMGQDQIHAIENGRMSELLSLLSDKQPLLADLGDAAQRIRNLIGISPADTPSDDPDAKRCRQLKDQAQQRFELLFDLEQKSETLLCISRDQIAQRLEASSHSMTAISAYRSDSATKTQGGHLDLSSDG